MDDKKEERKKESIDEILSDLNGLLNKMPSILEGIKLPEVKSAASAEEPVRPNPVPAPEKEDIFEKTIKLDPDELPPSQAGGSLDKMVLQSLGEFIFSPEDIGKGGARPPLSEPLALPLEPVGMESAPELPEIKPLLEGTMPDADEHAYPAEGKKEPSADTVPDPVYPKSDEAASGSAVNYGLKNDQEEAAVNPFESTRDFGVPDIDALLSLSGADVPSDPAGTAASDAAVEQGGAMDLKKEPSGPQDEMEKTIPGLGGYEPAAPFVPVNAAPEDEAPAVSTPSAEEPPAEAAPHTEPETVIPEPRPEAAPTEAGFTLEPIASPFGEPALSEAGEKTVVLPPPSDQDAAAQGFTVEPVETAPEPEAPGPEVSLPSAPAEEERTMIIAPPPEGPDGEKTVIFQAGADTAAETARRPFVEPRDFVTLAARTAPEGVTPEHVRGVAFLYAREDEALCAEVLAELDAICLKSSSSPMFIGRVLVESCEAGINGNVVMQKVVDAKAVGLVCIGGVPQETVYEIENVFTAAGVFFRHLTRENFNRSAALDLVMDLILK